jgi:hypothetical protein
MRIAISLVLISLLISPASWAGETRVLTDAERARVQSQVDELSKNKLEQGETARKNIKDQALRQGKAIDQKLQQEKDRIDATAENLSGRYGVGLTSQVGNAKKRELDALAAAAKAKVAKDAQADTAKRQATAKKSADDVKTTVDGLKSQVSKGGKYGLKPHGSNLYVRSYGKDQ